MKAINILRGLNNVAKIAPEGTACISANSRIDDDGTWGQGPSLANNSLNPTKVGAPGQAGNHLFAMSLKISDTDAFRIVSTLEDVTTIDTGPNGYAYFTDSGVPKFWTGASESGATTVGLTAPTGDPTIAASGTGTRQETGIYLYFYTYYDPTNDTESLPSPVGEWWVRRYYTADVRQADVPKLDATNPASGRTIRWYRSTVIKMAEGDTLQPPQTDPNDFYFVGECAYNESFYDYAHDSEIENPENLYTGRGSKPPQTAVEALAAFDNRMWYFKAGIAYWSSAGRPEEVPQGYNQEINHTYTEGTWLNGVLSVGSEVVSTLAMLPLLNTGVYGEAKLIIPELSGETVIAAKEFDGKLWVWTANKTGFITNSGLEGYQFSIVSNGIGLCSFHALAESPYGLFGADAKGIWLITDYPKRLSEGVLDLSSLITNSAATRAASFGIWVDNLNEYWWCINGFQIPYNALRGVFYGPYDITMTGGCNYSAQGYNECHIGARKTPVISTREGAQILKFWLGTGDYVLEDINIEMLYSSNDGTVTVATYHNEIPSETGATSRGTWAHTSTRHSFDPKSSGRFCEIKITIPSGTVAPIQNINFEARAAREKGGR